MAYGLMHSFKQTSEFLREVSSYRDQRFEMPDVLCILSKTFLIVAPGFCANQGLGRSLTFGFMRHVHLVRLDCPVKMLTAILSNSEPLQRTLVAANGSVAASSSPLGRRLT